MAKMKNNDGKNDFSTRREILKASALGIPALMISSAAAASRAASQGSAAPAKSDDSSMKNRELVGLTSFITGGARGIGLAAAEELAKAGSNIVLFDIASARIESIDYPLSESPRVP